MDFLKIFRTAAGQTRKRNGAAGHFTFATFVFFLSESMIALKKRISIFHQIIPLFSGKWSILLPIFDLLTKKPCQALFFALYLFESFFTIFHQLFLPQSTAFLPVFWKLWTNCDYIVNYVKNCCAFLWTLSLDFRIKVGDNVAVVVGTYVPIQNILYVSRRSPND